MPTEENDIRKLDESHGYHPELNFIVKLSINGVDVPSSSVVDVVIREWIFDPLPRLELKISDNGRYIDQFPFQDGDGINIEVNHFIYEEAPIKCSFKLQDYEIINSAPGKSQQALISITALMDNLELDTEDGDLTFPIKNRVFSGKSSTEVFQSIFSTSKQKKFDARIETKDGMNWIQNNMSDLEFINHVLKRSYLDNDDTQFLYTNRQGTMVYTSLKTELKKKIQEIPRLIYNINSAMLNSMNATKEETEEQLEEEREQEGQGNLYFYNWRYKNLSGGVNKTNSYGREFSLYDLTNNISRTIATDEHPLSVHSEKDEFKIGKITSHNDLGIVDSSNVHENYSLAVTQNDYLKESWFSSYLLVYTRPSNNINLFDRVQVEVQSLLPVEGLKDEVHSGQYFVGGIIHQASKDSIFNNIIILFRNGRDIKGLIEENEARNSSDSVSKAVISEPKVVGGDV